MNRRQFLSGSAGLALAAVAAPTTALAIGRGGREHAKRREEETTRHGPHSPDREQQHGDTPLIWKVIVTGMFLGFGVLLNVLVDRKYPEKPSYPVPKDRANPPPVIYL